MHPAAAKRFFESLQNYDNRENVFGEYDVAVTFTLKLLLSWYDLETPMIQDF